jgi:hypothetical protein
MRSASGGVEGGIHTVERLFKITEMILARLQQVPDELPDVRIIAGLKELHIEIFDRGFPQQDLVHDVTIPRARAVTILKGYVLVHASLPEKDFREQCNGCARKLSQKTFMISPKTDLQWSRFPKMGWQFAVSGTRQIDRTFSKG